MSRILKRPMFNRGGRAGALNSGIVSGFGRPQYRRGGVTQRQGYSRGRYVDMLDDYIQPPVKSTGMTTSDYLRLAAAGAEIMGAPVVSDAGGVMGALANASQPLSGLGTDLAASTEMRNLNYQKELSDYNKLRAGTAIEQQITEDANQFQIEQANRQRQFEKGLQTEQFRHDRGESALDRTHEISVVEAEFDAAVKLLKKEQELYPNKYKLEKVMQEERSQKIIEEMKLLVHNSDEYLEKKDVLVNIINGELTRLIISERADLQGKSAFIDSIDTAVEDAYRFSQAKEGEPGYGSKWQGKTRSEIRSILLAEAYEAVGLVEVWVPDGIIEMDAKGGRVGRYAGGAMGDEGVDATGPIEPGGFNPDPGAPPIMQASADQSVALTFQELRQRLPGEVSDKVINLILSSEEAMIDFAQLQTPQDIVRFNQKYNADLELPTQVA